MPAYKKRILLDMDGILVDFFGPLFKEYRRRTGERVVMSQILGWDMSNYVGQGNVLMDVFHKKGFFRNLLPNPGAIAAVRSLVEMKDDNGEPRFDVLIASYACTHHAAGEKIQWVDEHLPFLSSNNIFLCHRKEMIQGDCLVDDGLHNAAGYKIAWPKALVLGIAYPYNDDKGKVYDYRVKDHAHMQRAWSDILHLIKKNL